MLNIGSYCVRLEMRGELQVQMVLTIVKVFLQLCMGFLEMKYVLMIGVDFSDYLLVLLEIFEML